MIKAREQRKTPAKIFSNLAMIHTGAQGLLNHPVHLCNPQIIFTLTFKYILVGLFIIFISSTLNPTQIYISHQTTDKISQSSHCKINAVL
jgi:hypothetical protein